MASFESILMIVGGVSVGGVTISAIAYWILKLLSDKWLSERFAEKLEAFKHLQNREIEELKFEINRLFDRATKLHQREFEVVPKAWALLVDAFHYTHSLVSPLQSYADINSMGTEERFEFLQRCKFSNWEVREIEDSGDASKTYQEKNDQKRYVRAAKASRKFFVYFQKNSILIPSELSADFIDIDDKIKSALSSWQLRRQYEKVDAEGLRNTLTFGKETEAALQDLSAKIKERIWMTDLLDPKGKNPAKPLA